MRATVKKSNETVDWDGALNSSVLVKHYLTERQKQFRLANDRNDRRIQVP